jgi:hypothetical protein
LRGARPINRGGPIDACQLCAKSASGQMASMAVYVKVHAAMVIAANSNRPYTDD